MPSAPTHPSTRPAARKSRAPRRASAYPSPVMSDAAVVEPYRISQYVRCSQSPAASTEHDSVSSLDSDWPPTSRGASLPQDAPISPYCLSLAATPGLGIKYSPALFPGPDMASMPPTTVSPSMLECHHSTAHFSNASICSSIYEASEDAPSLDDYDMIHTPEPFLHDDATRIADDRTWFTSPGGAYEPTTLHHPLQLQYGPSEASCGMPPADFNGYELRRPVKRELHSQSPMQQDSEQDDESSSSSSPSSSGDDDMDDDTDIKSEAAARHPYNKPYENPKYTCATCGKDFMRTFNYNSHLATHNPQRERPFNCRWSSCDKKFFRSTDLKRHELSVSPLPIPPTPASPSDPRLRSTSNPKTSAAAPAARASPAKTRSNGAPPPPSPSSPRV